MKKTISFSVAQKKIITLWLVFSLFIFLFYLIQSVMNRFEQEGGQIWEWLLQFIVPPLTLMLGVLLSKLNGPKSERDIDRFHYRIALYLSLFFLIILAFTPIMARVFMFQEQSEILVTEMDGSNPSLFDVLKGFNAFLIPIQGITTLVLGFFFASKS